MKKFLLHILKYGLIVLLLLNLFSYASLYCLKNSSFYKPEFLTHEIKQKSFDYIIIGSSIGLTSLDTKEIDSITTKKGLNLSIDDTSISSNYLMLQHFFNQGKKTKTCVLAINYWDVSVEKPAINTNDYRFLPFISEDYVFDYCKDLEPGYFKPLTWSHYFPFFGVGYYNTEIIFPSIVAFFKPNMRNRFDEKGNYSYPVSGNVEDKKVSNVLLVWKNPYLKKIQMLCKENHVELVLYQAPIYNITITNLNDSFNFINDSQAIPEKNYYYDGIHMNSKGRIISSAIFAKEMKKNYFK